MVGTHADEDIVWARHVRMDNRPRGELGFLHGLFGGRAEFRPEAVEGAIRDGSATISNVETNRRLAADRSGRSADR